MKKFVISFIILLLLGGTAFFFGWMNIWVPADAYAVMVSKTSGYDEDLIGPESPFIWRWQHLLPTNVTLHVFHIEDHTADLSSSGTLPSGELFAKAAPFTPDFNYSINFTVTFRLRPRALIALVRDENLTEETLPEYYTEKQEEISRAVLEEILGLSGKEEVTLLGNPFALETELIKKLRDRFSAIEITRISPAGKINIPDPEVYFQARRNYLALLEEQRTLEIQRLRRSQELFERDDIAFERSIVQLERYGKLLEKYPVLLKYLYITGNNAGAAELPEIKSLFQSGGEN